MIVEPKVKLIASTYIEVDDDYDNDSISEFMEVNPEYTASEVLTEFAGRACYQSFHKPNPKTADTGDYLRRTLFEQKHWSIAEHASATFYITGVSRALTHELIRHRHLSYSQLSQRFVDESDGNIVLPPAVRKAFKDAQEEGVGLPMVDSLLDADVAQGHAYEAIVFALEDMGYPRKQAREAARAVLPNMTETRIVVTGNLRSWHEVIQRRTAPDADAEIQEVMGMVRDKLHEVAPNIFPKEEA